MILVFNSEIVNSDADPLRSLKSIAQRKGSRRSRMATWLIPTSLRLSTRQLLQSELAKGCALNSKALSELYKKWSTSAKRYGPFTCYQRHTPNIHFKYLHPSTNTLQNMEWKMLKRFRRSAAGYDEQLPSDIRTPKALLQTTNYLIRHVLNGPEPLALIHKFVWDRTRSVRNDFSVQQVTQEHDVRIAVTCLERIARFHIVSLHLLSSPANEEPFDRHQEREQLNNTMLSLMYYYDDNRGRIDFPNEDEFRAYYIIFSIHDQRPDLEARVQKWPVSLLESPRVQVAMELYTASCNTWQPQGTLDSRRPNAIAQGFYTRFFNIINSPSVSYLMACVAEIYFNYVRQTAIRTIWKGYCRTPISQQHRNEEWTVEELTRVLHFDDDEHTINFLEEQGLELATNDQGQQYLNWGSRHIESVGQYLLSGSS